MHIIECVCGDVCGAYESIEGLPVNSTKVLDIASRVYLYISMAMHNVLSYHNIVHLHVNNLQFG